MLTGPVTPVGFPLWKPVSAIAVALTTLSPSGAAAGTPQDSVLRRTPSGAIYHATSCAAQDHREPLVVYFQGTGLGPEHSRQFLRHVGDRTERCVVAVPYENSKLVASYCVADSTTGAQDGECLDRVLGAKAAATPSRVVTKSGGVLEVARERSAEGALVRALREIGLDRYLTADRGEARWDRLILTGASQGARATDAGGLMAVPARRRSKASATLRRARTGRAGASRPGAAYRRAPRDPRESRQRHCRT